MADTLSTLSLSSFLFFLTHAQILPGGVKVGIGAKKTGFCPIDSIADIYGQEIRDLNKVLVIGGRIQVEIDEITEDEKIDLICLEIYKQKAPTPAKKKTSAATPASAKKKQAPPKQVDEDNMYYDDDDDDDTSKFGYDDEW